MGKKLYVGNLNFRTTDDSLADAFAARGFPVLSAKIIADRETGRSRGFAFVEFGTDGEAAAALASMQDHDVDGRPLKVTEARAKTEGAAGGYRSGADSSAPRGGYDRPPAGPRTGGYSGGGQRGGFERPSYEGSQAPRSSGPDGGAPATHRGGGYAGGPPRGGYAARSDDRPARDGASAFRGADSRGPRTGGFGGPPPGSNSPFGAEEPAASRRGRGERRDLRKQHERRDEVFDEDDDY